MRKLRWKSVKMEDMVKNEPYALTLNPEKGYTSIPKNIETLLRCIDLDACSMELYPEISPIGRYHWHGRLWVHNILSFYLYVIPKLKDKFTFEIDTISEDDVWKIYCTKQSHLWECKTKLPIKIVKIKEKELNIWEYLEKGARSGQVEAK